MHIKKTFVFIALTLTLILSVHGQAPMTNAFYYDFEKDPCFTDQTLSMKLLKQMGPGWGYNYDSLMSDLQKWQTSPYTKIDSVGASVQNRTLWLLTISDSTKIVSDPIRITIHARTHPNEVQSTWLTNGLIGILLSDQPIAELLRKHCVFNIMPMYNPDGVELGYGRENANGVDLERNWDKSPHEPETAALKSLFTTYMTSDKPIRIALNMHSSSLCTRYFVYHHANGTSQSFAEEEQHFINAIRSYWPEGIQNWDYYISWTSGTPAHFPESWFWNNFGEQVMALTFEEMNCASAGNFERTTSALLNGIADYLDIRQETVIANATSQRNLKSTPLSASIYPNPGTASQSTTFEMTLQQPTTVKIELFDMLGRKICNIKNGHFQAGTMTTTFDSKSIAAGHYFIRISDGHYVITSPYVVLK
ncbi:MAG: T9SS type A sorting domain-containing protein [Caldithrix sp.]|nr:T9SS type A sorting domain-containing protein [Caldithrix sp.]